ncbi:restriction endonuclease subunit S [Ideonella sp. B508-1]|uniref:restriction endonuclease subunit S n=1 Tax=Ideonella sp. B508-1 TaxID=137716 RepID=UPI0003492340|nr:restriction endonuclease subunit S [Ideonella sp. B508-1]
MSDLDNLAQQLPSTWAVATLGDLIDYGRTNKAEPDEIDDSAWVLELEDVEKASSRLLQRVTFSERQSKSTKNRFDAGDVLYGKLRPYLNKVLIADQPGFCTTEIVPIKCPEQLDTRYLFYWLKHPHFLRYVEAESHGMNMPRLGTEAGRAAPLVLAPRPEQTRIADHLDTLLARIKACNDHLDAIPGLIKRFRQAVVRSAVTGDLTEEWRAENKCAFAWKPRPLATLGELGRGKSKHRPRNDPRLYDGKYPFVQTGDVAQSGGLIKSHRQTYSEFGLQQSQLWPAGTVCITIAANIADTAILTYPACFPDSVVGFVADASQCLGEYVKWAIDAIKDELEAFAPATAQKNINLSVLNDVVIRCPSLEEQAEIVRRGKALLAAADRIESRHAAAIAQAQRLTPLTLAKAFRGELVPQEANDEPASALLQRLAQAQAVAAKPKAPRGQPGRKKPGATDAPTAQPDWSALPDGAWASDVPADEFAAVAALTAVLKAWGQPMPQDQARLAAVLCLQPRLFTTALLASQATQWCRLVGAAAQPLPTQVARLQVAVATPWGNALRKMRARGDLLESGPGPHGRWTLTPSALGVNTTGWPDGRAAWVVGHLRAHGMAALLPALTPEVSEFIHARAA